MLIRFFKIWWRFCIFSVILLVLHFNFKLQTFLLRTLEHWWYDWKISWFQLVLLKNKYDGVPQKSRNLLLVHLKGTGLCCNIFLGRSWIRLIRNIHRNKFEQRKWRRFKIFIMLSPSKKILCYLRDWEPFRSYEKCFSFHLKSSFLSQDI